jgi:hypothetical protein
MDEVFVAGGTGYVGRPLLERLCQLGYYPKAVARPTSVSKVPSCCEAIGGDVLNADSYAERVPRGAPLFIWSALLIQRPGRPLSFALSISFPSSSRSPRPSRPACLILSSSALHIPPRR